MQAWVANRYYYQKQIPVKDAAILANLPSASYRRAWISRIYDHDGTADGEGGTVLAIHDPGRIFHRTTHG